MAALAAALQAELAGDMRPALVQAQRWSQATRYVGLSTEIQSLEQELLSLPMRLVLIEAKRDDEAANFAQIEKRVETLQARINARREIEARQTQAAAE